MKDLNEIRLTGRLTRDPEAKTAANGNSRATFSLAVDRGKDKNGKDKGAYFVPCQAWGKTGELAVTWCKKGKKILVTGKLFVSEYEKDGQRKTFTAVDVENFWLMERPERAEASNETPFADPPPRATAPPVGPPAKSAPPVPPPRDTRNDSIIGTGGRPVDTREPGDDFGDCPF